MSDDEYEALEERAAIIQLGFLLNQHHLAATKNDTNRST